MRWVSTTGGPQLLLSKSLLTAWGGIEPPSNGRVIEAKFRWNGPGSPATDYDRACDVRAWAATIAVGEARAIVLGDEPGQAAWWPLEDGGLLVRWVFAPSEAAVEAALRRGVEAAFSDAFDWELPAGNHALLIDSSVPGAHALDEASTLELSLKPGAYRVETAHWAPDLQTSMVVHRFSRRAAAARPASRSRPRKTPAKRAAARRARR